jgi:hypothetical protein
LLLASHLFLESLLLLRPAAAGIIAVAGLTLKFLMFLLLLAALLLLEPLVLLAFTRLLSSPLLLTFLLLLLLASQLILASLVWLMSTYSIVLVQCDILDYRIMAIGLFTLLEYLISDCANLITIGLSDVQKLSFAQLC